jgi:NAD(P)-dependent dehydrogenase (short-subunit alcohol dehydrogenase family)
MGRLDGKVALISGGARGQGATEAKLFVREGAKVVLGDVRDEEGKKVEAEIRAAGGEATYVHLNVTSEADWRAAVDTAERRYGQLHVLVNNAGILIRKSIEETTEDDWDRIMAVNVKGVFLGTKYAIPAMRRAGGGAIVNVSSISALRPRGLTTYSVSKGAVIALTRAMAVDHGPEGIRVNCVAPGPVYTPMVYQRGMSEAVRERRRNASLLKIEGTGWDIGHAVRFLLSDYARYVTGHVLVVDGGTTVTAPERDSQ